METIIALGTIFFLLAVIKIVLGGNPQFNTRLKTKYKYERRDYLMTNRERVFFDNLINKIGDEYYIFPQIHLSSLLNHKIRGQSWRGAFSHINQKSVDFVLCDKSNLSPKLIIELDDRSHEREDRIVRDDIVEEILRDSYLPLLRLKSSEDFNKEDVLKLIV